MITTATRRNISTPPKYHYYHQVTLNDHLFPTGFAHLPASLLIKKSLSGREMQVIVGSTSKVAGATVAKFAKELTKHMRVSRGWSIVNVSVKRMEFRELPPSEHVNIPKATLPPDRRIAGLSAQVDVRAEVLPVETAARQRKMLHGTTLVHSHRGSACLR
jgi:hypothetical protein